MRRCIHLAILLTVLTAVIWRPVQAGPDESAKKLRVFVSILPQAGFVEKVGGDRVEVNVLVGPGQSPATYAATHKQMARLAGAQVYFRIGVPFEEPLLKKIAAILPELRIVDTRKGIKLRMMARADSRDEEHGGREKEAGDEHQHEHGGDQADDKGDKHRPGEKGTDPHIWLDPKLVKVQARTICEELIRIDPEHAEQYRENTKGFEAELDKVDARIARVLAPLKGREFFVFHPAYGYFGDAYGLKQVPVEIEGKSPSAKQLAALIKRAKGAKVKVIFVQPQFSTSNAEAVARMIGGAVVPMDPLARDYLANLAAMAGKLESALGGPAGEGDDHE